MAFASATERRLLVALGSLVSLTGAAAFAGACSSGTLPAPATADAGASLSSDAPAAEAAPSCALPGRFGSAKCETCVTEQCCDRLDACTGDRDCSILSSCTLACIQQPDAGACATECRAKTTDPKALWAALEKCAYFSDPCAFECSVAAR